MELKVGMKAPDFTLADNQNGKTSLSDYRGQRVLLSWHPLAFTSVCTDQMRALEANREAFKQLGVVPLGISVDAAPAKGAWASALSIRETKLLSDFYPHGQVAKDYGIFLEELGASGRANFLIDADGYIRWMKVYDVPQLPDINEIFAAIRAL